MSLIDKVRSFIASEIGKLKKMPKQDRGWYIWEYYKIPIACTVVCILLTAGFLSIAFDNTEYALSTVVINCTLSDTFEKLPLTSEFHDHMDFSVNQKVITESIQIQYYQDQEIFDITGLTTLHTRISANQIDIGICDKPIFSHLCELNVAVDLEALLPDDLWEAVKPFAVYAENKETGKQIAAGIDITETAFAKECGFTAKPVTLCVISNSLQKENCIAMIRYIMDYSK